ncbi:hypothetical protein N7492_004450 [Penicillium capsulatum]|uniref:Uncharacterized protein n=1 Tax=Penicillium capsulatum TaxID=69766 RepID=A0A9W9IDX0_9EURO|nr:hypothetical protein N7492_004450 [Penicillium capsulatum]KAJ6136430.1 hypothetical protein N7512_001590 [Penicillium capsulatum]
MGLVKLLLKAILIPIVLLVVFTVVVVVLVKMRREKKKKEQEAQNHAFQPPPIQQWAYPDTVQKPAPVAYGVTPAQMEQGTIRP